MKPITNQPARRGAQHGFTMTELMVTMAIIGIVVALAIPSFSGTINHLRLNDATRSLAGEMLELRQRAVKDNTTYWLVFPAATPTTVTSYQIKTGGVTCAAATTVVQAIDMNERYPNVTAEASTTCFQFSSRGFFPATPYVIVRRADNANDFKKICVRISGAVKVQGDLAACA